jgi:molecular chaperone DnaK
MSYHLGVDLGTTFTAAAIARDGRAEPVTLGSRSVAVPSVAYLAADGRVVVGDAAARRALTEPRRVAREFKRRLGDPTPLVLGGTPIAAEMLAARSLAWVVTQVAATEGAPPSSLAVTHPANWGPYKLDLLAQAIRHVGLRVDHFVPEPVAAATTYATQRGLAPGAVVAVYDLGGGTFDAAVVRARGRDAGQGEPPFALVGRPDGIEHMGGIDFDHAVFRHVLAAVGLDPDRLEADDPALASALAHLRQACVEAKEGLSSDTDVAIPVMLPNHHTEVHLGRAEFEDMIRPALRETIVALRRAIASAEVPVEAVTAVLLVGGSSRIPLVGELVTAELGRPVAVDARPKDAVPVGAALTALHASPAAPAVAGSALPPPGAPPTGVRAGPGATPGPPGQPGSPGPLPAGRGAAGRAAGPSRGVRVGKVAGAVALAVVAAVALAARAGGDGQGGSTSTTDGDTTATTGATTASTGGGTATTSAGTASSIPPMPGDDWNPEARGVFVEYCGSGLAEQIGSIAGDPQELCGCIYDEMASGGADFEAVNEQFVLEDADPSSPGMQAMTDATMACAVAAT